MIIIDNNFVLIDITKVFDKKTFGAERVENNDQNYLRVA